MNSIYRLFVLFIFCAVTTAPVFAQTDETAVVAKFRQTREQEFRNPRETPLKAKDLSKFQGLYWYELAPKFRVAASFTRTPNEPRIEFPTFNHKRTIPHTRYGIVKFTLDKQQFTLNVYRNELFPKAKVLFIPFLDPTNFDATYRGGRYLDFNDAPANGGTVTLDFNLAYNPDCAYNKEFICPIPPEINKLPINIEAGERLTVPPPPVEEKILAIAVKTAKIETKSDKDETAATPKPETKPAKNAAQTTVKTAKTETPSRPLAEIPKKDIPTPSNKPSVVPAKTETGDAESRFADFDGLPVHYKSFGKGSEALILIHGWAGNLEFWREQFAAFPNRRIIAIDLPGHGKSGKPRINYAMDYLALSVAAVMKAANVKRAVLVGNGMGTAVIEQFYRLFPEQTLGLIIVDGALRTAAQKEDLRNLRAPLYADYAANIEDVAAIVSAQVKDENLRQQIRQSFLNTPDYVNLSVFDQMLDGKNFTREAINVPVLAIMAESSAWKPDTKQFYQTLAPKLDYRSWQNVGNYLMLEKPREFTQTVRYFLNQNQLLTK